MQIKVTHQQSKILLSILEDAMLRAQDEIASLADSPEELKIAQDKLLDINSMYTTTIRAQSKSPRVSKA